jgi:hypothetical protein
MERGPEARHAKLVDRERAVMHESSPVIRRPGRASHVTARTVAAMVVLALLLAACGRSPSSPSGGTSSSGGSISSEQLAFSQCMRSHGLSSYPDPTRSGLPKVGPQQLGVTSSEFQAAETACQHLLPTSGQSSQSQDQQMMNAMLNFARCVRSHGVPSWPDPLAESDPGQTGTPGFPRSMPGINQNSPQVKSAMAACQHFMAGIGYGSGGYP